MHKKRRGWEERKKKERLRGDAIDSSTFFCSNITRGSWLAPLQSPEVPPEIHQRSLDGWVATL